MESRATMSTHDGNGTPANLGDDYQVAVVGAGQAGLAIGYFLQQHATRFVIVDGTDAVGSSWRSRWDSLRLFTSRGYDALPGMDFPGDASGYPSRDEVIAYLETYVSHFELPVELNAPVRSLRRAGGRFSLEAGNRTLLADAVVVATGAFQLPAVPKFGEALAPEVVQMHSALYRNSSDVPTGRVVVVGGGNTGYQIAAELSKSHSVQLAIGSRQMPLPQRILGRDLFWWLTRFGLIQKTADTRIGRRTRDRDTLIGSSPRKLRRTFGVELKPRVTAASGRTLTFADGTTTTPDAVIWATGYRSDYSWIDLPILDDAGAVQHRRGVSNIPDLYFLGLPWQHTRGSALLGWVKDDAEFLADRLRTGVHTNATPVGVPEPAPAT